MIRFLVTLEFDGPIISTEDIDRVHRNVLEALVRSVNNGPGLSPTDDFSTKSIEISRINDLPIACSF